MFANAIVSPMFSFQIVLLRYGTYTKAINVVLKNPTHPKI